jgi:hypothetical protein
MDDDLQNPPEEVERLLTFAQGSGKEVIYTFYDDKRHPFWRNLGSRFANQVADFVLEKPRGLYLSSFRCMSAFVVREITRYEGPFPYVDGLILQVTHDVDRLMVRHLPRAAGRSNYTLRRLMRLWASMFVNFSVMPLRVSTITGFILSGLGALAGAMVIAEALTSSPPAGWAITLKSAAEISQRSLHNFSIRLRWSGSQSISWLPSVTSWRSRKSRCRSPFLRLRRATQSSRCWRMHYGTNPSGGRSWAASY